MAMIFKCACGKELSVADEDAGKTVRCPDCGKTIEVPARSAVSPPRFRRLWIVGIAVGLAVLCAGASITLILLARRGTSTSVSAVPSVQAQLPGNGSAPATGTTAVAPPIQSEMRVPMGFRPGAGTSAEKYTNTGWAKEIVHEKSGIEMVFIPAGEFMMGPPANEAEGFGNTGPQHSVIITKPLYMGKYEVTQGQWQNLMGNNPRSFKGRDRLPVEKVSWDDCQDFCRRAGDGLRLPTEAEWEYACRAGTGTRFSFGDRDEDLHKYGNYCDVSNTDGLSWQDKEHNDGHDRVAPVGSFMANRWGLCDMHGNVREWCGDDYSAGPLVDPTGVGPGEYRVLRGGSWRSRPWQCRSAHRDVVYDPSRRRDGFGLRVVRGLDEIGVLEKPKTPPPPVTTDVRVPAGFRAAAGTAAEPYTNTGWAKEIVHEKTGIEMVFIPAGEFMMGSPANEAGRSDCEGPQHKVRITKPFYMGKYEVTQGQWHKVMGNNPSQFKGSDRLPAETISWNDCPDFCRSAGDGLRLPTEAEWEYACRAGTTTRFSFGDRDEDLHKYGNYCDASNTDGIPLQDKEHNDGHDRVAPVGSLMANQWGLYDMHGNMFEWCEDWYGSYGAGPLVDPTGVNTGEYHVLRGGSWINVPRDCRSAARRRADPSTRYYYGHAVRLARGLD